MKKFNDQYNSLWDDKKSQQNPADTKFWTKPVPADVFFKKWLKTELFPRQYAVVKKVFNEDFTEMSENPHEFVLAWGKRSGKDLTIANLLTYMVYWLCCLKDPQDYLGIKSGEPIDLVNISFDEEQAKSVFFEKFTRKIKGSINPETKKNFFTEIGMDIHNDIHISNVTFPKNIRCWSLNSVKFKAEGKNIVFAIFDEIGTFRFDKAKSIHDHIKTTAKPTCKKYYKLFFISFLTTGTDYMSHLVTDTKQTKARYVEQAGTWDIRSLKDCPKELQQWVIYRKDYQDEFDKDPVTMMLMYGCQIPKYRTNNFIKQADRIIQCVNYKRVSPIILPDDYPENQVWVTEVDNIELEHWFRPHYTYELYALEKEYERNPSETLERLIRTEKERQNLAEYYVHLDLSRGVVDCAGLVLGHKYYILDKPKIYIDLMLQVRSLKTEEGNKEIDMEHLLRFVTDVLVKERKFKIEQLTADGWNSALFLNICNKKSIPAKLLSIDKDRSCYDTLKDFIYRTDLNMYNFPPVIRELTELITTDKNKVDHPSQSHWRAKEEGLPKGSKDISDCLAGIARSSTENEDDEALAYGAK